MGNTIHMSDADLPDDAVFLSSHADWDRPTEPLKIENGKLRQDKFYWLSWLSPFENWQLRMRLRYIFDPTRVRQTQAEAIGFMDGLYTAVHILDGKHRGYWVMASKQPRFFLHPDFYTDLLLDQNAKQSKILKQVADALRGQPVSLLRVAGELDPEEMRKQPQFQRLVNLVLQRTEGLARGRIEHALIILSQGAAEERRLMRGELP